MAEADFRLPITAQCVIRRLCGARTANLVGPMSVGKRPSYVENAFELMGTPGQWYFDRSASTITFHAEAKISPMQTLKFPSSNLWSRSRAPHPSPSTT